LIEDLRLLCDEGVEVVNNGGMPLYLYMNDIMEIVMGSQMLNIIVIQL